MLEWFSEHSDWLNFFVNAGMLLVWVTYLHVFLRSYRRQVLPKIVINRAAGSALDAYCFVSNMSSEPIYIESVIVTLECGDRRASYAVTDVDDLDGMGLPDDPRQRTHQGPLGSAQYTSLGKFDDLIRSVSKHDGTDSLEFSSPGKTLMVEVVIIADYAAEDLFVGARRRFKATPKGQTWRLIAETPETEQIRSRHQRKRIIDMLPGDRM